METYTWRMAAPSTRLRLHVSHGAHSTAVVGRHGRSWKLRIAAAPERGKANEVVLRFLAERLALPRSSLRLVSGQSGRDKIVELTGIDEAETDRRLQHGGSAR
jgi:uncharacterized protein YggU (UPF0235/DUF167 family)